MSGDRPSGTPTSFDVAALAGVSRSAVSRAFTPGTSLSHDKKERILAAADRLGYRPNVVARSLNKGKSQLVGLVFGQFDNPFFAHALEAFNLQLAEQGLRTLFFTTTPNASADEQVAELLTHRVSAVILMAVNLSSRLTAVCASAGIPVVQFNRTAQSGQAISVTGDNAGGARAIADLLIDSGRSRIAFMAGYEDSSTSQQREAAFVAALAARGCELHRRDCGAYTRAGAIDATRRLFRDRAGRPDALFCANDFMALAAIETLREEFGLDVGRDVAVVGFDDIALAAWPSFSLTTYSQPIPDMVATAVGAIAGTAESGDSTRLVVPGSLVRRNSA